MPRTLRSPRAGGGAATKPAVRTAGTIGLAATGLALAACTSVPNPAGSGSPSPSDSPSSSTTPTVAVSSNPPAPLTGLPAASGAVAGRPAVAVLVGGTNPAGLGSADVVYEEIAGSVVRYLAVFQSAQASAVSPVTGTRPEDGQILSVLHPLAAYDGGTSTWISILHKSKIVDAGAGTYSSLYTSTANGPAVSTTAVAAAVKDSAPPPLFRYRGPSTGASTLAGTGVSHPTSAQLTIPGYGTQSWTFNATTNRWELTSGGPRVSAANVVVQSVSFKTVYESHKYGITVPSARVIGRGGHAVVLSGKASGGSGGTAAAGTWAKPNMADVTGYYDASGLPMAFQPGPNWVILVPARHPGRHLGVTAMTGAAALASSPAAWTARERESPS